MSNTAINKLRLHVEELTRKQLVIAEALEVIAIGKANNGVNLGAKKIAQQALVDAGYWECIPPPHAIPNNSIVENALLYIRIRGAEGGPLGSHLSSVAREAVRSQDGNDCYDKELMIKVSNSLRALGYST